MSSEVVKAVFLGVFLSVFFAVNLANAIKILFSSERWSKINREAFRGDRTRSIQLFLAAFGTLAFFTEAVTYCFCVFFGSCRLLKEWAIDVHTGLSICSEAIGFAFVIFGCAIFLWSVLERGRRVNLNRLVTWSAFRYVRHPSYVGYFLMFAGFVLLLRNPIALLPLVAVPGYVGLAVFEEQLLVEEFGDSYVKYQKRTGRFIPKLRSAHTDAYAAVQTS